MRFAKKQQLKIRYLFRIMQLLHEACVFLYSWNAESLGLGTDGVDKIIIRYGCCADGTLDFGGIAERDRFVGGLQRN